MRSFGVLLIIVMLASACSSAPAPTPEPGSLSGVFPMSAFLARTTDVLVLGSEVTFSPDATVDFGSGVTVTQTALASPTAIQCTIAVDPTAATGPRDVTVSDQGQTYVLTKAFTLDEPTLVIPHGTMAQGSVLSFSVVSQDPSTPFDTSAISGFLSQTFIGVQVDPPLPLGMVFQVANVTAQEVVLNAEIDVKMTAGPLHLVLASGTDPAATVKFPFHVDIAARTPTPVAPGSTEHLLIDTAFGTTLSSVTAVNPSIVELSLTTSSSAAAPGFVILPSSGLFSNLYGAGSDAFFVPQSGDVLYAIVQDGSGGINAPIDLVTASTPIGSTAPEAASNDTPATAQPITTLPFVMTGATLSSNNDLDWLEYQATASDVGKHLVVATAPTSAVGSGLTDTYIEIFPAGSQTPIAVSADSTYQDEVRGPAIPSAGAYDIVISPSYLFDPAHTQYQAIVMLE